MPEKSIYKLHFLLLHFFKVKQSLDPQSSGWTQGLTVNRRMSPLGQSLKVSAQRFSNTRKVSNSKLLSWRRERLPTPVFWPREFHGLYSPRGRKESDTTERLFHFTKLPKGQVADRGEPLQRDEHHNRIKNKNQFDILQHPFIIRNLSRLKYIWMSNPISLPCKNFQSATVRRTATFCHFCLLITKR